jgi:hypothetical protein
MWPCRRSSTSLATEPGPEGCNVNVCHTQSATSPWHAGGELATEPAATRGGHRTAVDFAVADRLCHLHRGSDGGLARTSFSRYTLGRTPTFIGIDNYIKAFTVDPLFWPSLGRTLLYTSLTVPLLTVGALSVAMLMNQNLKGKSVFRTLMFRRS